LAAIDKAFQNVLLDVEVIIVDRRERFLEDRQIFDSLVDAVIDDVVALIKPSEIQNLRVIYFADQFPGTQNPYVGIDFLLNGHQYDFTQVNYVVDVGGVEEWRLVVGDSQHGGSEGHPFHIHVNSFEVISVNGKLLEPGTIKDTVWIPAESTVVIRMRFKEYVGKSVFHCHILPHEDTGMMQNFLIKKRGQPFPPSIFEPPMHPRLRPLPKTAVGGGHM